MWQVETKEEVSQLSFASSYSQNQRCQSFGNTTFLSPVTGLCVSKKKRTPDVIRLLL